MIVSSSAFAAAVPTVTREKCLPEFVQSIGRSNVAQSDFVLSEFSDDEQISPDLSDDLSRAVNIGLVRWTDGDMAIRPQEATTRLEALVIMSRTLGTLEAAQAPTA